ncbi:MAG: P-loop NTPase [Candidatus Aminicenantes bacterium]|nr:P-loop NTPase [Candidatus Aminicenantes bacterium]
MKQSLQFINKIEKKIEGTQDPSVIPNTDNKRSRWYILIIDELEKQFERVQVKNREEKNNELVKKKANPSSTIPNFQLENNRNICTVAGGKGGTGKSFISASLAVQLASTERDVVLIDADLGCPNLHTILGVKEANLDLGDFVMNKILKLEDAAVLTPYNGLKLIKGANSVLFMENLNYYKKLKLIRHIKALNEKQIIVDLGSGTSFNTLDLFILSNTGILVINPEKTSMEATYYFLKSCMIRILKAYIKCYKIQDLEIKMDKFIKNNSGSIFNFFNDIISLDKASSSLLFGALEKFKPNFIINKVRDEKDFTLGKSMIEIAQEKLALDLNFLGSVPYDERVHTCQNENIPFITIYPNSATSISIRKIAEKMMYRN